MDLDKLARRGLQGLRPVVYPAADAGMLRMDANTNLLGLNPAIQAAFRRLPELNHYPTAYSDDLRRDLATLHGVSEESIVAGNGSDEILDFLAKAFLNPDDVAAVAAPSFVMQKFYASINLGRVVEVPLRGPDFQLDVDGLLKTKAKLYLIASPNNPTANCFDPAALEALIDRSGAVVAIDEAYAEYCTQNFIPRIARAPNLVVLRTFSKAYGLAGLRVGYALAQPPLVRKLYGVKPVFSVNGLGEAIAVEALRDRRFMEESVRVVRSERERLASKLRELGLRPCRSDANFMLVDLGRPSAPVREALRRRKILVRDMADFAGLENCLRVTVGRPEHTDAFLGALREALGSR